MSKICKYCNSKKDLSCFPKHVAYKDNLDSRCRDCIKKQTALRKKLRLIAPPKPKFCECCGLEPNVLVLDHDHNTEMFRGWLCDSCNIGIGKLGDDVAGLEKALNYLKKSSA